jgi:probable phosphoglycerate mutase
MTARRVICWRHGQTAFNIEGKVQGATDTELDQTGRAQVTRAAAVLALATPTTLITSDLRRAAATAAALAEATGLPATTDPRLRERAFGQWEGLAIDEIRHRWPAEFAAWRGGADIPALGMETRPLAAARFAQAVTEATEAARDDSTLVFVSHGGVTVCGITALLGLDPTTWRGLRVMANAHWADLEPGRTPGAPWRLVGNNIGPTASDEEISGHF